MTSSSAARRQLRIGLIGYGEIGHGIGLGLRREGLERITAYDIGIFDGPFISLIRGRAAEAGVALAETPAALAAAADIIIVAVPGSACVEAAQAIAPHLTPRHLYIDIGSATPRVKLAVEAVAAPSGAKVGDGGIMGSPLNDGHRILIAISGPAAAGVQDALVPWGMRLELVSAALGAGSGLKIMRSVVMKGVEALLHECAIGSARYGIREEVFASIAGFMDERPFLETIKFLLRTGVIHAERRAEEAAMSAEALIEAGVEPLMTQSTARMLRSIADMRLKEHFGGKVPEDYRVAAGAVAERVPTQRPAQPEDISRQGLTR